MGILNRYASEEDKEELAKNLKLPIDSQQVDTQKKSRKISVSGKDKSTKQVKDQHSKSDNELLSIIRDFMATYKESNKTSRMIRIQDSHYRELVGLRADGISVSEFISFAVHFALKSKDYDTIINQLKQ